MRKIIDLFRSIWLALQKKAIVHSFEEAVAFTENFGYPVCLKPAFTLHGAGTYTAQDRQELTDGWQKALDLSPVKEILVEKIRQL
jgi:carbamoyl-phosphate synthase large subunit